MLEKKDDVEQGEVIAVHGETVTVRIGASKNCEKCHLCKRVSPTEMVLQARFEGDIDVGDRVVVNFRPGTVVKSALILYILPLIGLVAGYFAGQGLSSFFGLKINGELFSAATAIVFMLLSFIPIKLYDRKKREDPRFKPFVTPGRFN